MTSTQPFSSVAAETGSRVRAKTGNGEFTTWQIVAIFTDDQTDLFRLLFQYPRKQKSVNSQSQSSEEHTQKNQGPKIHYANGGSKEEQLAKKR